VPIVPTLGALPDVLQMGDTAVVTDGVGIGVEVAIKPIATADTTPVASFLMKLAAALGASRSRKSVTRHSHHHRPH
jgi:hypothetical protein